MREHIKILGILNIVMGSLTALVGLFVLLAMGGAAGIMAMAGDSDNAVAAPILGLVGAAVGMFFLALSLPSILGGWGLLRYKNWSRVLMIIVSLFHLLHVPLGTALGVYGLWVLFNEQTRQLLETGGALPLPASQPMPQQSAGVRPQTF